MTKQKPAKTFINLIEQQTQKNNIKEAYLQNAINKYKEKRKEEMSQGRTNRNIMNQISQDSFQMNESQNNFKSFDNVKREMLVKHNRSSSIAMNQGKIGQMGHSRNT